MKKTDNISKVSVTRQTAQKVLEFIRESDLKPGDFLPTEVELIKLWGVSRNAIREAISYLKGLGILESRRGSGVRVAEADPIAVFATVLSMTLAFPTTNLDDLIKARKVLELGSIKEAVTLATDENKAEIASIVSQMKNLDLNNDYANEEYCKLEADFHCAIMKPASCRLLSVMDKVIRASFENIPKNRQLPEEWTDLIQRSTREHSIIADAFALDDPLMAFHALDRHLSHKTRE